MSAVFILLMFGSLGALIVGLIKPSAFKNKGWENPTRKRVGLLFGIAAVLFFILTGVTASSSSESKPTSTPTPKQETQATPQPTSSLTPSPTPVSFDSSKGNNPVAANYAVKLINTFGKQMPGFIKDAYVRLDPEDMGGKSNADYEKSLNFGTLSIVVDADSWSGMADSLKKDFVAGVITVTKSNINVYPRVTVSDGLRTVAEGSWSLWNGEANITLK